MLARKYEAPSKRIRTSLHAYLSRLGLENPVSKCIVYQRRCNSGPTKDSSNKAFLPKAYLYSPKEPSGNGETEHVVRFHHFSGFLSTKTCHSIKVRELLMQSFHYLGLNVVCWWLCFFLQMHQTKTHELAKFRNGAKCS